jgi:uncharacterized protein YdhG (YjbR/CyaY superfamily)
VIYFGAFKTHIGMYPITPPVKKKFAKELSRFEGGKGTIRFPLDEPIPYSLIARIAKYKAAEAKSPHPPLRGDLSPGRGRAGAAGPGEGKKR